MAKTVGEVGGGFVGVGLLEVEADLVCGLAVGGGGGGMP